MYEIVNLWNIPTYGSADATSPLERYATYNKEYCWQYGIRKNTLEEDLKIISKIVDVSTLSVNDFVFKRLEDDYDKDLATKFLQRYEWLGTVAMYTTHWFGAFYNGNILAGVITMSVPTAFSGLGDTEKLISRGACVSWSPKCLASHFLMWCIRWMAKNTPYRYFSAYSDPSAKELGTIYQACNFYYLGNNFGASHKYVSPYSGKIISDRSFRARSYYWRYAKELGIEWQDNWQNESRILWENIPDDVEQKLRARSKLVQSSAQEIVVPNKHKYLYILGKDKKETKLLRKEFLDKNKIYEYPKERGK